MVIPTGNSFFRPTARNENKTVCTASLPIPTAESSHRNEWLSLNVRIRRIQAPSPGDIFFSSTSESCLQKLRLFYRYGGCADQLQKYLSNLNLPQNTKTIVDLLENLRASKNARFSVFGNQRISSIIEAHFKNLVRQAIKNPQFIYFAFKAKKTDLIKEMQLQGLKVNTCSSDGNTPLHLAILNADTATVAMLLENGANPNALNSQLDTPLHMACDRSNTSLVKTLLSAGALPNIPNDQGYVPLHYACNLTNTDIILLFLSKGAKTDHMSDQGDTPLGLLMEVGPALLLEELFSKHPTVLSALRSNNNEMLPQLRERIPEILATSHDTPLEIPFLLGDLPLAQGMAAKMTFKDYQAGMQALKEKYPGACINILQDALVTLTSTHLIESGELTGLRPPMSMEMDEWKKILREIPVAELMNMFDEINFSQPDKPGYYPQTDIVDGDGNHFSSSELRYKLQTFIQDIVNHIPKIGTPPIECGDPERELREIMEDLSPIIAISSEQDTLREGIADLIKYLDHECEAFPIHKSVSKIFSALTFLEVSQLDPKAPGQVAKLKKICNGALSLNQWYQNLNDTVKAIIYYIQKRSAEEKTEQNPSPYASTVVELALAGGLCGTRYSDDSNYIYHQVSENIYSLREQILLNTQRLHHRIAQSMVNPDIEQNIHILNRILQIIDEDAGLPIEARRQRFYFSDVNVPHQLSPSIVLKEFERLYTPSRVIAEVEEAVNGSNASISRDLVIDWFKENIPSSWEQSTFTDMTQAINGLDETTALAILKDKYAIWLEETPPVQGQLLKHFLSDDDRELYCEITARVSGMRNLVDVAINFIKKKYNISLNKEEGLQAQVDRIFFNKTKNKALHKQIIAEIEKFSNEREKAQYVKERYSITLRQAPSISQQLEKERVSRFLAGQVIDPESGSITHSALIYLLKNMGILSSDHDG